MESSLADDSEFVRSKLIELFAFPTGCDSSCNYLFILQLAIDCALQGRCRRQLQEVCTRVRSTLALHGKKKMFSLGNDER